MAASIELFQSSEGLHPYPECDSGLFKFYSFGVSGMIPVLYP
jgi:hypothetical protein